MQRAGRARVHVGVMGEYGAAEPGDLDDPSATVLDVAYLAEYGRESDPHVPAREPLRTTFERELEQWRRLWLGAHRVYLRDGDQAGRRSAVALGVHAYDAVRDTYASGMSPALSPFTIENRRHGGDVPFVDTGATMRSNISEITDWSGEIVVVGQEGS